VAAKDPDAFIDELWSYARALEMREHPWFQGVREHRWTRERIVRAPASHARSPIVPSPRPARSPR